MSRFWALRKAGLTAAGVAAFRQQFGATAEIIPLETGRTLLTALPLGDSAGTPVGALGIAVDGHNVSLVGEAASGNTKTNGCRFAVPVPNQLVPGAKLALVVGGSVSVAPEVSATLSVNVYHEDDLIGEAEIALSDSDGLPEVVELDTEDLTPISMLTIELEAEVVDTGGATGAIASVQGIGLVHSNLAESIATTLARWFS